MKKIADLVHRKNKICPYLVPDKNDKKSITSRNDGVQVRIKHRNDPKHSTSSYPSLLHLWNTYYHDWFKTNLNKTSTEHTGTKNDSFPRLIVRYEDLLYHTEEVITKVCNCGGGKIFEESKFKSVFEASKEPWKIPSNDLVSAAIRYGSLDIRNSVLTVENEEFATRVIDRVLIDKFNYLTP